MPTYRVTDPSTMKVLRITGDSPPSEDELLSVFSSFKVEEPKKEELPAESWTATLPSLLGGIAGGFAKTVAGRAGASGVLAGGGEAYHQIYQAAIGDPNAPQTSLEAVERIAYPAGEQAIGGLVGEGIIRGAAKFIPKVLPQYMKSGIREAESALRPYMEQYLPKGMLSKKGGGPAFTIAQKADPLSSAAKMENIIESSFFGGTPIKKFKFAQEQAIEDYASAVTDKIWNGIANLPPSQRGEAFIKSFDIANDAFKATATSLYKRVDDLVGKELVDTTAAKKWADLLNAENIKMVGIGASEAGDTLITKITKLPDKLDFSTASELRSRLLKEEASLVGNDKARGIARKIVGILDDSMEGAATKLSPDAKDSWREANLFYREGKEKFNNEFTARLIRQGKEQPELVGKAIFQGGEISQIQKAKEILKGDPATWQAMKAGYWETILNKATDPAGKVVGKQLHNQLKTMGKETLNEIFTPKERLLIETFKKAILVSQTKTSAGGGSMLIQLMQAPALGAAITAWGGFKQDPETVAAGLSILFAPRIFGKMMVSPKWQPLFMQGLSTSKPIAMPAIAKLAMGAIEMSREKTGATREY